MMKKFTCLMALFFLLFTTILSGFVSAGDDNPAMDSVEKAYVVAAEDTSGGITYQMIVGGEVKNYFTQNRSLAVKSGDFVTFKAKQDRIIDFREIVPVTSSNEKIMAKDEDTLNLDLELKGIVGLSENFYVYQILDGQALPKTLDDVYVGAENASVFYDEAGKVFLILLDGKTPVNNMRIGINTSGFATLDHDQLDIQSADGFTLVDKKANQSFEVAPNALVSFVSTPEGTKASVNGVNLYTTPNRLYTFPVNEASKLQIMTFKRSYGYPGYRGYFEITPSITAGKLNLINEIQLEQYLYQVVPSEMPAFFGLEALKAQSVAARTYALSDYYRNRYANKGFHVDDSTLSQVYNNSRENSLTTQAVTETKGMIMESNGDLVDARYYSTSGGYGASKHEVWADDETKLFPGTPIPYLTARSFVFDPTDPNKMFTFDTSNEEEISRFYKDLSYTGYDSESYYFRWKVSLSKTELENTINQNIKTRFAADPTFILTKDTSGSFVSMPIPEQGVGTISNLYVTKRGAGGNMMELVVEGSTGTYKIIKEFNIRFTVRPNKTFTGGTSDVLLHRSKGGSTGYDSRFVLKNYTILPSAFATFDLERDGDRNLTSVTFYGGGNGHAAGMSQYGAFSLGTRGWTYDQILNAYYAGMQLVDVYGE
jgi:stage II sporulation protein D